jgi:hypothetical protein
MLLVQSQLFGVAYLSAKVLKWIQFALGGRVYFMMRSAKSACVCTRRDTALKGRAWNAHCYVPLLLVPC